VLDHPDVAVGLARHALADGSDHAVAGAADPERADHDQIVLRAGKILQDLRVMLPVHHPRLEIEARLSAKARHAVEIAVGDELEAHRDQAVVDLPLPLEFDFVDVFLGQRVLHLPEAVVVQFCRVDVASDELRGVRLAQIERTGNSTIGVVRVVDRNVDALIHGSS
jgi:hypothetical protein